MLCRIKLVFALQRLNHTSRETLPQGVVYLDATKMAMFPPPSGTRQIKEMEMHVLRNPAIGNHLLNWLTKFKGCKYMNFSMFCE